MKCKFCQAEWDEETTVCPVCGEDNAEQETQDEEETLAVQNEADEETVKSEEPAAQPKKAKMSPGKLAVIYIAVLAVVAVLVFFVFFGMKGNELGSPSASPDVTEGTIPEDGNQDDVTCQGSYTVSNSKAKSKAGKVIATAADGTELKFNNYQMSDYINALADAGFLIEKLVEQTDPALLLRRAETEKEFKAQMLPLSFVFKARKL